jgi:hypothetical protein
VLYLRSLVFTKPFSFRPKCRWGSSESRTKRLSEPVRKPVAAKVSPAMSNASTISSRNDRSIITPAANPIKKLINLIEGLLTKTINPPIPVDYPAKRLRSRAFKMSAISKSLKRNS